MKPSGGFRSLELLLGGRDAGIVVMCSRVFISQGECASVQQMVCGELTSHFGEIGGEGEEVVW